jgi:ligand-binding SRPBCC domain-containing protein
MKEYTLRNELQLPRPRTEVFSFFADARNLGEITPPWLEFEILTPEPGPLEVGLLIDYRIRVNHIPIRWQTKIVEWNPPHRFVDIQTRGPYTHSRHTHIFEEHDGGTLCLDLISYRPRGGSLTNSLFVQQSLIRILDYRTARLKALFQPGAFDGKEKAPGVVQIQGEGDPPN